jgi:hypothetical protein
MARTGKRVVDVLEAVKTRESLMIISNWLFSGKEYGCHYSLINETVEKEIESLFFTFRSESKNELSIL